MATHCTSCCLRALLEKNYKSHTRWLRNSEGLSTKLLQSANEGCLCNKPIVAFRDFISSGPLTPQIPPKSFDDSRLLGRLGRLIAACIEQHHNGGPNILMTPFLKPSFSFENFSNGNPDIIRHPGTARVCHLYLPTLLWLLSKLDETNKSRPIVFGISAPIGCGKTTMSTILTQALGVFGLRSEALSIDDFYLTHEDQCALAGRHRRNPLLQSRGLPGTHDLPLARETLRCIREAAPGSLLSLPRYDKRKHGGQGDRCPSEACPVVAMPLDVLILEGWCVGYEALGHVDTRMARDKGIRVVDEYSEEEEEEGDGSGREYMTDTGRREEGVRRIRQDGAVQPRNEKLYVAAEVPMGKNSAAEVPMGKNGAAEVSIGENGAVDATVRVSFGGKDNEITEENVTRKDLLDGTIEVAERVGVRTTEDNGAKGARNKAAEEGPAPTLSVSVESLQTVNEYMRGYSFLNNELDYLIALRTLDVSDIFRMREEAEAKARHEGKPAMSPEEIRLFCTRFETCFRLYLSNLFEHPPLPPEKMLRITLDSDRAPVS